jgi:hypothetical protein
MGGDAPLRVTILKWHPEPRGHQRGFADVALPHGLILDGCSIHANRFGAWAWPPKRLVIDPETGTVLLTEKGNRRRRSVVHFASDQQRDAFGLAVLSALLAKHPHALDLPDDVPADAATAASDARFLQRHWAS